MSNINLEAYSDFVNAITSPASTDFSEYIAALHRLNLAGVDIARLDTAFTGLASESGEALDIVKKLKFHGKDWSAEIREQLERELGDVIWYWINACRALKVDPAEVIANNVAKLKGRHPTGEFQSVYATPTEE